MCKLAEANRALVLILSCLLLVTKGFGLIYGDGGNRYSTKEELFFSVYSNNIDKSVSHLKNYFEQNKIELTTYTQNNGFYSYRFNIRKEKVSELDSLINLLGFRASKSLLSSNAQVRSIQQRESDLEHVREKKKNYEKLLVKIDSTNSKLYLSYYEKIMEFNNLIFIEEADLKRARDADKLQAVLIELHDDYTTSEKYDDVQFVHMPGAEFNMLFVENPTPDISAQAYQGYSLKYLFTRGKSYFTIGALKPVKPLAKNDSISIKDIFNLTFGQDFYNRHLGRGKRQTLNLYLGYHVGLSNARSYNSDRVFVVAAPVMGLELFKNKYINIDVNGSYFIPLTDYSYTLRGVKLNASLNFSF